MKNINTKNTVKGFTLIELMVVIAIIGVLATIISAPIQTYLKKSRDAKKIADINQIKDALGQYAVDNAGLYPASLSALTTGSYLKALPSNALSTAPDKDKYMYVTYDDLVGPQSYHLGVALEFANAVLLGDDDCRGTTCYAQTVGISANFRNAGAVSGGTYGAGNPAASAAAAANSATPTSDFNGAGSAESLGGLCTATLTTCVYDVTP